MPDPGPCIRLDTLVLAYPHHEAVTYLSGRGFDPAFIGKYWGASYCVTSPRFQQAAGRIIIPIFHTLDGTIAQVGWQARYIGDDVHGEPFNKARVPKYWTSPCLPRHLLAYNVETALQHPTVVIVEGATDVWNVGPMATAVLSTSASEHVLQLIAIGMRRHGNKAVVIVALDPQPPRRVNPRPTPHPIAKLTKRLSALLPGRVVPLYLPGECDPGSIDRRLFLRLARDAVRQRGLVADFTVRDRPPVRSLTATDEHALREHEYQQQLPRRAED